jgi:hypothetical protein
MVQSSYVLDLLSSHKGNVVFDWSEWVYLVWVKDSIIEAVWQELSSCMSSIALAIPTLSVTVQALTSAAAGRTVDTGIVEVNSVSYRALDHIHLVAVFIEAIASKSPTMTISPRYQGIPELALTLKKKKGKSNSSPGFGDLSLTITQLMTGSVRSNSTLLRDTNGGIERVNSASNLTTVILRWKA